MRGTVARSRRARIARSCDLGRKIARLGDAARRGLWKRQGMAIQTATHLTLEPAAQAFADAAAVPPLLQDLSPDEARSALEEIQAAAVDKLPVQDEWVTVRAAVGDVRVRIVKPQRAAGSLPAVLYMHGGGWIIGSASTHDRLVRELAVGARAAVVFVEYDRSPEARYPVAIEQGYATAQWIGREGEAHGIDPTRIAVAGESVGGNMAAALALMAKERGDVRFVHQALFYPVTDAGQDTASYRRFATGYHLTAKAMEVFWDAYAPDAGARSEITASPLKATTEQLTGLPPAFVAVDEADVLRDEGEEYAAKLRAAGVEVTTVRYDGTIHDFMMLNPLAGTRATRAAVAQAVAVLDEALSPTTFRRTELQHVAASVPGRLIVQGLAEIPAGTASGRHSHPGEEVGYIVRGDVAMEFDDGPTLTLHTGDPFLIPPGTIHNARNIGTVTTRMLSTYLVPEDEAVATLYS
jgi:acetyl esterase